MGNGIISGTKFLAHDEQPEDGIAALAATLCAQTDQTIVGRLRLRVSLAVEYDEKLHQVSGSITFFDAIP